MVRKVGAWRRQEKIYIVTEMFGLLMSEYITESYHIVICKNDGKPYAFTPEGRRLVFREDSKEDLVRRIAKMGAPESCVDTKVSDEFLEIISQKGKAYKRYPEEKGSEIEAGRNEKSKIKTLYLMEYYEESTGEGRIMLADETGRAPFNDWIYEGMIDLLKIAKQKGYDFSEIESTIPDEVLEECRKNYFPPQHLRRLSMSRVSAYLKAEKNGRVLDSTKEDREINKFLERIVNGGATV